MSEEQQLVEQVLRGDMQAFRQLVKNYEKLVWTVAARLIEQKEEREDLCQEVFIKVYRGLPGFAFESKLSTWIARITYLTAINHLRKDKYKTVSHNQLEDLVLSPAAQDNPGETMEKKSLQAYLNQLIDQMPPAYKTVITLFHLQQCAYDEIVAITGMPAGTVKVYLLRARKLLKEKLETFLKNEQP
ncbi:MAG: RNA polymerase sigma factor [Dinghuibacter sp.]|nr:RNA polymerase sigma factor [Dinghuibacter sp.]